MQALAVRANQPFAGLAHLSEAGYEQLSESAFSNGSYGSRASNWPVFAIARRESFNIALQAIEGKLVLVRWMLGQFQHERILGDLPVLLKSAQVFGLRLV